MITELISTLTGLVSGTVPNLLKELGASHINGDKFYTKVAYTIDAVLGEGHCYREYLNGFSIAK